MAASTRLVTAVSPPYFSHSRRHGWSCERKTLLHLPSKPWQSCSHYQHPCCPFREGKFPQWNSNVCIINYVSCYFLLICSYVCLLPHSFPPCFIRPSLHLLLPHSILWISFTSAYLCLPDQRRVSPTSLCSKLRREALIVFLQRNHQTLEFLLALHVNSIITVCFIE